MKRRGLSFIHTRGFIAVVIALAILGLVLTTGLNKSTQLAPPTPSPSSPVTINYGGMEGRSGETVEFTLGVRNIAAGQELVPHIECEAFSSVAFSSQQLEPNEITTFLISAQIEGEPGSYTCTAEIKNLGSAQYTILITQ